MVSSRVLQSSHVTNVPYGRSHQIIVLMKCYNYDSAFCIRNRPTLGPIERTKEFMVHHNESFLRRSGQLFHLLANHGNFAGHHTQELICRPYARCLFSHAVQVFFSVRAKLREPSAQRRDRLDYGKPLRSQRGRIFCEQSLLRHF